MSLSSKCQILRRSAPRQAVLPNVPGAGLSGATGCDLLRVALASSAAPFERRLHAGSSFFDLCWLRIWKRTWKKQLKRRLIPP